MVGEHLDFQAVIDHWQGVTAGLFLRSDSGELALAWLIAWDGPRLSERVYAVADVPSENARVYLRNMRSDYCDLGRHQAETDALIASASIAAEWIATSDGRVTLTGRRDRLPGYNRWQDLDREQVDEWRDVLAQSSSIGEPLR